MDTRENIEVPGGVPDEEFSVQHAFRRLQALLDQRVEDVVVGLNAMIDALAAEPLNDVAVPMQLHALACMATVMLAPVRKQAAAYRGEATMQIRCLPSNFVSSRKGLPFM